MKLYVHYEETDDAGDAVEDKALTLKFTLPKSWVAQPLLQVLELFLESYNKKKASLPPLNVTSVHLEKAGGVNVHTTDIVKEVLSDRDDLYVKPGAEQPAKAKTIPPPPSSSSSSSSTSSSFSTAGASTEGSTGLLRCKNYGCNQSFSEEANIESACRFHMAPPVFHDTKKGWACCSKRVYDWDEFHTIEGCATGRHSSVDPKEIFAQSPTLAAANQAAAAGGGNGAAGTAAAAAAAAVAVAAPLKSIEDYNQANPDAATAAKGAASSVKKPPTKCTVKPDGSATCLNKGCQKGYQVKENHPTACCYHASGPVFHDAGKFWSCCPGVVKYDFEDFLKIPGCMLSSHYDGSEETLRFFESHAKRRDDR